MVTSYIHKCKEIGDIFLSNKGKTGEHIHVYVQVTGVIGKQYNY